MGHSARGGPFFMPTSWSDVSDVSTNWTGATAPRTVTVQAGQPMGLLLCLTYPTTFSYVVSIDGSDWTDSSDPTTNWS